MAAWGHKLLNASFRYRSAPNAVNAREADLVVDQIGNRGDDDPDVQTALGIYYRHRARSWDTSLVHFNRARTLAPGDGDIMTFMVPVVVSLGLAVVIYHFYSTPIIRWGRKRVEVAKRGRSTTAP